MPHRLDFDSIHQNLFVLLNLVYGAKEFAKSHNLSSDDDYPISQSYYLGWLKYSLSEKLIDTAVKTRIILDMIRVEEKRYKEDGEQYPVDTRLLDEEICTKYNIATSADVNARISLRECCNKIIHALDIQPLYEEGDEDHYLDEESETKRQWKYWDGSLDLSGNRGADEWRYELFVSDFCSALEELVSALESRIDWSSIHQDNDAFS